MTSFQLDLAEERRKKMRDERTNCDLCGLTTKRLIINLLILASLGGAGYLIYFVSIEQAQVIILLKCSDVLVSV